MTHSLALVDSGGETDLVIQSDSSYVRVPPAASVGAVSVTGIRDSWKKRKPFPPFFYLFSSFVRFSFIYRVLFIGLFYNRVIYIF